MTSSFFALHRLQQVINSLCNLLIMNSAKKCHKTLQYTAPRNDFCSLQKMYIMNILCYVFSFELSSSSICRKEKDFLFSLDVPLWIHIYCLCVWLLILLGDDCFLSSNWRNDRKIRNVRDTELLYPFPSLPILPIFCASPKFSILLLLIHLILSFSVCVWPNFSSSPSLLPLQDFSPSRSFFKHFCPA